LPGVRGIGEKTASALVTKYGSIDKVIEAARIDPVGPLGKVAAQLDYVERAVKVVKIPDDAPVAEMDLRIGARAPSPDLEIRAKELALNGPVERLLTALADR
jgi:5'-3' exonuclease